jgi:hypothetical protein
MALALPIFLLLMFGILDLGRAVWEASTAAEAARQGARYAVTAPSDCSGIRRAALNAAVGVPVVGTPIIIEPGGAAIGQPVTVTVTVRFTPLTPLISAFVGSNGLTLTRSSTMLIQFGSGPGC